MSDPKDQHFVPQCYLRQFVDPNTPPQYEPYVWVFSKDGRKKKKKAPTNIFKERDLYTLQLRTGENDYSIEKTLAQVESEYASAFEHKISNKLPLSAEEHLGLCIFVATMLQRTLRHRDNIERFLDELIEKTEVMEKAHGAEPKKSLELKSYKENAHKLGVVQLMPDITELLIHMSIAFFCADNNGAYFITSDDPCTLFNPDLQWQKYYGPGLAQKNIELILPLSPDIAVCMTWGNLKGYMHYEKGRIDELNRMTRGHCQEYFISHSSKKKRIWFSHYPRNPIFFIRVISHKVRTRVDRWLAKLRYRHVR